VALPEQQLPSVIDLELHAIRLYGGTQSRVALCEEIVAEYTDMMNAGVDFPPVRA